jgi:hypothetical protein
MATTACRTAPGRFTDGRFSMLIFRFQPYSHRASSISNDRMQNWIDRAKMLVNALALAADIRYAVIGYRIRTAADYGALLQQ